MKLRNLVKLGIFVLTICVAANATSQQTTDVASESMLREKAKSLTASLERFEEEHLRWFSESFFRAVPHEKLIATLKENGQALGAIQRTRLCRMLGPHTAELEFISTRKKRLRVVLQVEAQAPHRILHMVFGRIDEGTDSWEELRSALDRLPGKKSISVLCLNPERQARFTYQPDEALAVGSSFKLIVLATLADQIATKQRKWEEVVSLREEFRSLPSGLLQDWPAKSPVTMHTLATLMISKSDNTAADHLIHALGRIHIEDHQTRLGIGQPKRNQPFLTTAEHFKLKLVQSTEQLRRYGESSGEQRRNQLKELEALRLASPRIQTQPMAIDKVEWFFSAADLCRILATLQMSSERENLLPILAIAKPFDIDDHEWEYLGFKGGAELGVLNLSLLGKLRKAQQWYALSLTWNRMDSALDEPVWVRLAERMVRIVERENEPPPR